jgi:hypothetical protein
MNGALIASGNGNHCCVDPKSVLDIAAELFQRQWQHRYFGRRSVRGSKRNFQHYAYRKCGRWRFAVNNAIIDPVGAGYSAAMVTMGTRHWAGIARNANVDGNNTLGYRALLLPVSYGSLIATPAGGNFEWDGAGLYCSPTSGVRGLVPVYQCSRVIAAGGKGLNNDATAQSFLPRAPELPGSWGYLRVPCGAS